MNENKEEEEEDSHTSIWNAPLSSASSTTEGFVNENDSTAFPVLYMKEKLENMREKKNEEITPNIFEQTNYKNIELFETIHEPFVESLRRKPRGVKWKQKQARKKMRNSRKKIRKKKKQTNCAAIAQQIKNRKDPVNEIKRIYRECCDGIAAGVQYGKIPNELSGEMTDKKSEKYTVSQRSKWLQSRVGEFFVVIFTMVMAFSVMFYSTETFKNGYDNPMDLVISAQEKSDSVIGILKSGVEPIKLVLVLLLQDVMAPFTILLNLGLDFVPTVCNGSGLSIYPQFCFILVFGIFFGLIWAIYLKFDWFLKMFFDSFQWKINPIMFLLVFLHIFVRVVTKMIKPDNTFDEIFYRPKSLGPLIVLGVYVLIRILLALFLVPIAQMFFGFGFLLLFFIFPVGIIFFKKSEPAAMSGGGFSDIFNKLSSSLPSMSSISPPSLPTDMFSSMGKSLSADFNPLNLGKNISTAYDASKVKTDDYWLKTLKQKPDGSYTLLDTSFPILLSIPLFLRFSKTDINKNNDKIYNSTRKDSQKNIIPIEYDDGFFAFFGGLKHSPLDGSFYEKVWLFLMQNIIPIIFMIFFITHAVSAGKNTSAEKPMFYIIYTTFNTVMIVYFLWVMVSRILNVTEPIKMNGSHNKLA